jgi:hypothetical protein
MRSVEHDWCEAGLDALVAAIAHPEAKIKETFSASPTEQDAPKVKF